MKARVRHIDDQGNAHVFEIHKAGYVGSSLELGGDNLRGLGGFEHEGLDTSKPLENPIIFGRLELNVLINSTADESLLNEIKVAQNRDYMVVWKFNGNVKWKGYLLPDISTYNEDQYPYTATFTFKDFTVLEGIDIPLLDDRKTIIQVFTDLLAYLNFELSIKTVTSMIEMHTDTAHDFLRQIYIDNFALRQYAQDQGQSDVRISVLEGLKKLLYNYGMILKQDEGVFVLDQIDGYENPVAVPVNTYNSSGVFQSRGNENLVVIGNVGDLRVVVPESYNEINPGLKQVTLQYDHRTKVSGIVLPQFIDTRPDGFKSYKQFFQSTGVERIKLSGFAYVIFNELVPEIPYASVVIRSGGLYWNDQTKNWQGSAYDNRYDMRDAESRENFGLGQRFTTRLNIVTSEIPVLNTGEIEITFNQYPYGGQSHTYYTDSIFELENEEEEGSTSLQYILRQQGDYDERYAHPAFWYGDGPTDYARSAMRFSASAGDVTNLSWQRRGSTDWRSFAEILASRILGIQRVYTRKLNPDITGSYGGRRILLYDGEYHYYLGGAFNLSSGKFTPVLFKLGYSSESSDQFDFRLVQAPALMTNQLLTAIDLSRNETIDAIGGFVMRLTLPISGEVSQLVSSDIVNSSVVVLKNQFVRVNHPQTLKSVEFVVRENHVPGSNIVNVVPKEIVGQYPAGSPVYVSSKSIALSLALGEIRAEFRAEKDAVAVLTQPVSGYVSKLPIYAFTLLRKGSMITIFNEQLGQSFYVKVRQNVTIGDQDIDIDPEMIIAPAGSFISQSNRELASLWAIDPGSVLIEVEESKAQDSIGLINQFIASGVEYTQLLVTRVSDELHFYDEQKLYVTRLGRSEYQRQGEFVLIDGDQVLNSPGGYVAIKPKIFVNDYIRTIPTFLVDPAYNMSSRITIERNRINATVSLINDALDAQAGFNAQITDGIDGVTASVEALASITTDGFSSQAGFNASVSSSINGINDNLDDLSGGIDDATSKLGTIGARSAMFADTNGNLAIIELLSGTISSFARVKADQVEIGAETTFLSNTYNPSTKETPAGAQSKATAAENAAKSHADSVSETARVAAINQSRNSVAAQLGYVDYNAMVAEAVAGKTVINGGMLNTVLLNVAWIFAQNVSVDGIITIGSGQLRSSSGRMRIRSNGMMFRGDDASPQVDAGLTWMNNEENQTLGYMRLWQDTQVGRMQYSVDGTMEFLSTVAGGFSFNRAIAVTAAASAGNHLMRRSDGDSRWLQIDDVNVSIAGAKRFVGSLRVDQLRSSDNSVGQSEVLRLQGEGGWVDLIFKQGIYCGTN